MAEEKKTETVDTAPKAAKEEKKKDAKSSKPGLGAKIKKFFKDYKSEMKKIVWYSREQTVHSSIVVIVCIVFIGAVIAALDFGFSHLLSWIAALV